MKKEIIISFVFNIIGLFSLFIIDLQIAKMNNDLIISSWALTKSTLFIGLVFVLVGLDQAIVRMKLNISQILLPAVFQFLIIAYFLTFIVNKLSSDFNTINIFISLFVLAMLYLFYAEHRLNLNYSKAQFSANGWKFLFLCLNIVFGYQNYIQVLPIALSLVFLVIFINRGAFKIFKVVSIKKYKYILTTGLHYFITLLTLTVTLYIDQLILNADGKIIESSILYSHITFFVGPNAILIGFGGFLLVPYLKKHPEKKTILFKKYFWGFFFVTLLIVVASYFFGHIMYFYFKSGQTPSLFLTIGLSVLAFLRYLYILPSSYVGSFASNLLIRRVAIINTSGIILYVIVYFSVSRYFGNYLIAILSAILTVWIIRIVNEYSALFKIIENNETI